MITKRTHHLSLNSKNNDFTLKFKQRFPIKSKFEHTSWTVCHAMDNTMMNLKTTYNGPMNPNDNNTCKSSKLNVLDLEKAP